MPMADQPRAPSGLSNSKPNGLCRTCGALSFASDECSNCVALGRADAAAPVRRHPFLPTARRSVAQTPNGTSRSTPTPAASNASARASGASAAEGAARANGRANGSAGGAAAPRNQQAMKTDASEADAIRPGSSLLAPSGSSTATTTAAARQGPTVAAAGASAASASAPSTTTTTTGSQPSRGGKRSRPARDVIDLVSSDEESEDHQRREAKRARQVARMHQSNARLSLRRVESEQEDVPMATPETELEDRIRPSEPPQGRRFDSVQFNETDFPTAVEVAQILRGRSAASAVNSTASSAVSTPSSALAPAPLAREPTSTSLAPTEPRTARTTTATTTRTTTATTITSTTSARTPLVGGTRSDAVSYSDEAVQPAPALHGLTPGNRSQTSLPAASSANGGMGTARLQSSTSLDDSATPAGPRPVVSAETPVEQVTLATTDAAATSQHEASVKTSTGAATGRPVEVPDVAAVTLEPVTSKKPAPVPQPSPPPSIAPSAVATSQPVASETTSAAVAVAEPVPSVDPPPPAAAKTHQPVSSLTASSALSTSLPAPSPVTTSAVPSQPVPALRTQSSVDLTAASPNDLIVLDDSDDDSDEDKSDDCGPALFQSRRFQSVVFNARDFVTANDGLNLARRSSTITQLPTSPVATGVGLASSIHQHSDPSPLMPTNGAPTTTSPAHDQIPSLGTNTNQPNILQARRKPPSADPPSSVRNTEESTTPTAIKIEVSASQRLPIVRRIIKPALGQCSTDFLNFMRDCDDQDEDEDEAARAKLLEVVDLTNLSDDSLDDDDDEDDYFEIIEAGGPLSVVQPATNGGGLVDVSSASSIKDRQINPEETGPTQQFPPVGVKRTRAPRPKETCAICEEKAWIKALVQCPDCKKYYHKKCAREYGDENVCYICETDGIIDDSELTEEHKNELIRLFATFRQSSDSDQGDDGGDEDAEEKNDSTVVVDQALLSQTVATTKSTRRWGEFLNVSTAPMEESFNRVTSEISQELLDEERKLKYSRGFVVKEEFEKDMSDVVDHYADLQDREERRVREDRSRAPANDTAGRDGTVPEHAALSPPGVEGSADQPTAPGAATAPDSAPNVGPH